MFSTIFLIFQAERERGKKNEYDSDREGSVTPSEEMTSSPCARHNGSYKSHGDEEALMDADGTKWLLHRRDD